MLALLLALATAAPGAGPAGQVSVSIDSARKTVVVVYRVPQPAMHDDHATHAPAHAGHAQHVERLDRFAWPVAGWIRGARVEVRDPAGAPLPHRLLHHVNLLNFERPQLVHAGVERLWGAGQESGPVMLPAGIGVPVRRGAELGMLVGFAPTDLPAGSTITLHITWTPANTVPRPVDMMPVSVSINQRTGVTSAYELPAGRSERTFEFTLPIAGRALGAGGHLHHYGVELRLEEAATGRVVVRVRAIRDSLGRVEGMEQRLLGVWGAGKRLKADMAYRLVASYDNPTGAAIPDGGMATLAIGFVPDRIERWPAVDPTEPEMGKDLAQLGTLPR